jgi:hypothetical protein
VAVYRLVLGLCVVALACSGGQRGDNAGGASPSTPAAGQDGGSVAGGTAGADGGEGGVAGGAPAPNTGGGAGEPDGGAAGAPDAGVALQPPITRDHWTFYGTSQGLSADVSDVSADEGGNVYVAGGEALYAKKRGDQRFLRFDAANAGLTQNCYPVANPNDPAQLDRKAHPTPPGPPQLCPVISVGGAAPGVAMIGFQGIGTDGDPDADWAQDSGGADLVAFDGTALTRTRHVFIASPPHTICAANGNEAHTSTCSDPGDWFWVMGRRKLRQVFRIAVNHDPGSPMYGDVWMGGTHATFAAYVNRAQQRGWVDDTGGQEPKWADAKYVWEHDHPGFTAADGTFLTGYTYAVAIDPRSGIPWAHNGFRLAAMSGGYGANVSSKIWWLPLPWIDVWPDTGDPRQFPSFDAVMSLSFCGDGTLWMGSEGHGLARRDPGTGAISTLGLPDPTLHGNSATAVACDPSDGSLWIGLGWGGVMRLKNGSFSLIDPTGLPEFTRHQVLSIQIDRSASPRVVYFAFLPVKDATGHVTAPGGVAAYDGP